MQITEVRSLGKGKYCVELEQGKSLQLYKKELQGLSLEEGQELEEEQYHYLLYEVIGKRAKKRAMYLLEKMDRTESQLREKLQQNGYPEEVVDLAVEYVKKYHYIDDFRYACTYIRYRCEKKSRRGLTQELLQKGVSKELIQQALEREYESNEEDLICDWMRKKHFNPKTADVKEQRKMYQFLLRKGFQSNDILTKMHSYED